MRPNEGKRDCASRHTVGQKWSTSAPHIVLPYKVDRRAWPLVDTAPWDGEPDGLVWQWSDQVAMLVARDPRSGAWNGYAGVRADHYMWGQEESDFRLRWDWQPHGGITYAGEIVGEGRALLGLTVFEGVWWFGFDCSRALDATPANPFMGSKYRDLDYVITHTERLAAALSTPVEQTTKAARTAWTYAGETYRAVMNANEAKGKDPHHVRWLGTKNLDSDPFTRLDVEHYIASRSATLTKPAEDGIQCAFTTLVKLFDGRFALVEAASSESDWGESMGVAKCCHDLQQMRDYLARSHEPRVAKELIHMGRLEMLAPLESYCKKHYDPGVVFGLKRKDIEEADAAFELAEEP
jgi:hypothetical protein